MLAAAAGAHHGSPRRPVTSATRSGRTTGSWRQSCHMFKLAVRRPRYRRRTPRYRTRARGVVFSRQSLKREENSPSRAASPAALVEDRHPDCDPATKMKSRSTCSYRDVRRAEIKLDTAAGASGTGAEHEVLREHHLFEEDSAPRLRRGNTPRAGSQDAIPAPTVPYRRPGVARPATESRNRW
jgi:hypothetical protein